MPKTWGVVEHYHEDLGWGVIEADGHPGGCWVHFSAIVGPPPHSLRAGEPVGLISESADQDGFAYRAVKVWRAGAPEPDDHRLTAAADATAYSSFVTIQWD
jgi:CspA family cold shock protein